MPPGDLELNSQGYFIENQRIVVRTQPAFAEARSTDGQQRQANILPYSTRVFNSPIDGFGLDRIKTADADNPAAYRRFFDADADIWPDGVRLPLLKNTTSATGLEVVRRFIEDTVTNNIGALWEDDSGRDVVYRVYNNGDWTGGGVVENGTAAGDNRNGQDVILHKGVLTAALIGNATLTNNGDRPRVYSSSDGVTWTAYTNHPDLSGAYTAGLTQHQDINAIRLLDLGSELCCIAKNDANTQIEFMTTADSGGTAWTAELTIQVTSEIRGATIFRGVDGEEKIYILTDLNLIEVDFSEATWTYTIVRELPGQTAVWGDRLAVFGDGKLYMGIGVPDDVPPTVYTLQYANNDEFFDTNAGLTGEDTVISDMLGPVRFFHVSDSWLFMNLGGGAASRQARILRRTTEGSGWLPVVKHGTANIKPGPMFISNKDENATNNLGTPRLHYALRTDDAAPKADSMFNVAYPTTNPTSGVSIDYEASGYVSWPYMDNGMPTVKKTFHKFRFNVADVSADTTSGEFIRVFCGDDDAARTTDFAGNVTSGAKELSLAGGKGVEGTNIAMYTELRRDSGDTSDTPVLRDFEIDFTTKPDDVEQWEFTVDINKTAELVFGNRVNAAETIVDNLIAAEHAGTNVPFTYGQLGTKYVDVELDWELELRESGNGRVSVGSDFNKHRVGKVGVIVREPVFVTGGIGPLNNYIDFDGTDDEVKVTTASAIENIFTNGGSIGAWIRPDTDGENNEGSILNKNQAPPFAGNGWFLRVDNESASTVKVTFSHAYNTTAGVWTTTGTIPTTTWSRVDVNFNSSMPNTPPVILINGSSVAVTTSTAPVGALGDDSVNDLLIGDVDDSDRAFDGGIDDVSLWNRERSLTEIAETYQFELAGTEDGLVGYWKMNEGTGTNVADATANGNDGTLTGGAWGF